MSPPLRVLIVDDEPPARSRLRALLAGEQGLALVDECEDGLAAVERLRAGGVDLVLLDVEMPGCSGLEVVREVGPADMPPVVFVTAYDEFAIQAFEVHALDYLLKPYDRERLRTALARARVEHERRATGELGTRLSALLADGRGELERMVLRTGGRVLVVDPQAVDWIEAAGNYLRVHIGPETHLVRSTLKRMVERLAPHGFLRIHRSLLVNRERVRELRPRENGEYSLRLEDGTRLRSGRRYRDALAAFLA